MNAESCKNVKVLTLVNNFDTLAIFFPAGGTNHKDFTEILNYLTSKYDVLVVDSGYFGLDAIKETTKSFSAHVFIEDLYGCFNSDITSHKEVILIGQSFGCIQAFYFMKYLDNLFPGKVSKCLLAAPPITEYRFKVPSFGLWVLYKIIHTKLGKNLTDFLDRGKLDYLMKLNKTLKDVISPMHRAGAFNYLNCGYEVTKYGVLNNILINDTRLYFLIGKHDPLNRVLNQEHILTCPRCFMFDCGHSVFQNEWKNITGDLKLL
jgi:hypothetical protein